MRIKINTFFTIKVLFFIIKVLFFKQGGFMSHYTIKEDDIRHYLSPRSDRDKLILPKNKGYFSFNKNVVDGHQIYKYSSKINDNLCIEYEEFDCEQLYLCIALEGKTAFSTQKNQKLIPLEKSFTFLSNLKNTHGFAYYQKDMPLKSLSIAIDKNTKSEFLKGYKLKSNIDIIKYAKSTPKVRLLAEEIYHCSFSGGLGKLYLQSKISELLFLELLSLRDSTKSDTVKFSAQDKKALNEAVEILRHSFENPPSIKELSKRVSLNEFKLKYGFKKFFNTAPYEMAISFKMQKAKELLEASELNIGEISSQIGFKYQGHFSKTFYKHFGILPKDVMRDRKYYY